MALVSPPKPWQQSQPETIPTSSSSAPSASSSTSPAAASPSAAVHQPVQASPSLSSGLYQPNSFGYGQSSIGYNASPSNTYMPSSYSGSSYGSPYHGMHGYGSSYGSSNISSFGGSYGNPYSPAYNQWGTRPYNSMTFPGQQLDAYKGTPVNSLVNSGHALMSGMQQHVSTFGRFSQILHMNLDALQMSFSSILQLLTNASLLRHELSAFFGTFGSIRAIYLLYVKLRQMILRLFGRNHEARKFEFEGLWQDSSQGRWGWMPTFVTLSLAVLIIRRFIQFISSSSSSNSSNNMRSNLLSRSDQEVINPSHYWPAYDSGHQWQSPAVSGQADLMQSNQTPPRCDQPSFDQVFSGAFATPDF